MKKTWLLVVAAGVVAGIVLFGQSSKDASAISVDEARDIIVNDSTAVILDCRTPGEFTGELGHINNSILIPVQELEGRIGELEQYKDKTILAVCRTGRRSGTATDILRKHGFKAINVKGGMVEWNQKNFPIEREKN